MNLNESQVRDMIVAAYIAGCNDVQANYQPIHEGECPGFGEAADDYAASVMPGEDDDPHEACSRCGDMHPVGVLDEGLCPPCGDEAEQ